MIIQLQILMCFLSVYRLKYLISLGIVITLLIGIALLYVLVYSYIISSVTIQVQSDFRTVLISVFLSTSMLMILSSLSGIYGLIRKKNKFVVFYAITMLLYMVSFVLLGILTLKAPSLFQSQCEPNSKSVFNSTVEHANSLLCKDQCECYYSNSSGYSAQKLTQMGILNYSLTNASLPTNAQNCPSWSNTTYSTTGQIEIIQLFFNCSGWCVEFSKPPYFLFSNINGGTPDSPCAQALSSFMDEFGHIILITSFTVFGFICIILIIITCLCCHPERGLKYDSLELFKQVPMFIQQHKESQITGP